MLQPASSATRELCIAFFLWERYMPKCQCDCEWTESIWVDSCVLQSCSSAINWSSFLFFCANCRVCPIKLLSGTCWYYLKESAVSESKMEEELKSYCFRQYQSPSLFHCIHPVRHCSVQFTPTQRMASQTLWSVPLCFNPQPWGWYSPGKAHTSVSYLFCVCVTSVFGQLYLPDDGGVQSAIV